MERAFGLYGQPDRRVEAVGAVLRGTRGVVPVVYSFTRHTITPACRRQRVEQTMSAPGDLTKQTHGKGGQIYHIEVFP